ncbi:4'-phosphopantetheinyl transferase family protein [Caviibacterium pharyngocola]|uniref:4'-phosphopantetheinyl transferase n=1 Tax=Caviibacterium pharyngocola TaxID=28159 RepID=A0A2M8RX87_9PAST|nr:4'-phosphopantetheinyl transferase superfamily protein [Caviibacterium pharyngocola]PJG83490.1 4'-phosphopantetheinyl transferase [Caviibacterium pharyngocola]
MSIFVAWGNSKDEYPLAQIPQALWSEKILAAPKEHIRLQRRYRCRRAAHFLLWQLSQKAGVDPALLARIEQTDSGRPYFPVQHIDFNISHSGDWVAVVLQVLPQGQKSAVGIDIEFAEKSRNFTALLQHFAAPQELNWFADLPSEENFYRIWCGREALLKSQGAGIAKLSEVQHYPQNLTLYSQHCPRGELIFSAELPFYFALFANQSLDSTQYFAWRAGVLSAQSLAQAIKYQVNPLKS